MKRKFLISIAMMFIYFKVMALPTLLLPQTEKDTLKSHYSTVLKTAISTAREGIVELKFKYNVPVRLEGKVFYYLKEREQRKQCYNYIYKDSVVKRVRCKLEINSIYRDSINSLLIPISGNEISGENISLVLHHSRALGLDEAQYQYIMNQALEYAREIYNNPRANVWNDEINFLRNALTPKQITNYFFIKNAEKASKDIKDGWDKIVDAGLTQLLDSAEDVKLAYMYYQEYYRIKDVYRYYGTSQKKYLTELNKEMPPMIKLLETIKRGQKAEEKKSINNNNIGKEAIW